VFADKHFESVIGDGMEYVGETERRFDVIIVDSTDPQGPGAVLFTKEFYARCKRCLKKGGILVTQNGVPILQPDELSTTIGHFRSLFKDATCYVAAIPTYVGGHMAMGFASDNPKLRQVSEAMIAARYKKAGRFSTKYWTPAVHRAAFALPRFIQDLVDKAKPASKRRKP
jgi:spermidine synthase